jgi:outer membrane protein assembly factor BamB
VRFALALVLLLAACRPGGLQDVTGGWTAAPSVVAFPRTGVGQSSTGPLTFANNGRNSVTLTLAVTSPFSTPATVELAGGASQTLALTFSPLQEGISGAVLHITGGGASQDVTLSGVGVTVVCPAPSNCQAVSIHNDGTCTLTPLADGTDCASTCLDQGKCSDGQCIGVAHDCSDPDPCTVDTCVEGQGCLHAPLQCPPPDDACQVAVCASPDGCGVVQAADGTKCGTSDCTTSRVCISGACVARPTPDGASCGSTSPCQSAGTCSGGVCTKGGPTTLTPEWAATASTRLDFSGVMDSHGDVYDVECNANCELVARTPDGSELLRAPAPDFPDCALYGDFILAGSTIVLAHPGGDSMVALDATDGHTVWNRQFGTEIAAKYAGEDCPPPMFSSVEIWPVVSDGQGHLAAGVFVEGFNQVCHGNIADAWIVTLDVATGATRWMAGWAQSGSNDISAGFDEAGNLYVVARFTSQWQLSSYAPSGAVRWQRLWPGVTTLVLGGVSAGHVIATDEGTALHVIDSATGNDLYGIAKVSAEFTGTLTASEGTVLAYDPTGGMQLLVFNFMGTGSWTTLQNASGLSLQGAGPEVLTSRSTVVFSAYQGGVNDTLEEIGLDGMTRFECALPNGAWDYASAGAGHWVAQRNSHTLESYAVSGLEAAPLGWVTARGTMSQESRPR